MLGELELLVTFLVYIGFFAWFGAKRGALREAIVFFGAALSWLVLSNYGDLVRKVFNLMLGAPRVLLNLDNPGEAFAQIQANPVIPEAATASFVFLLWLGWVLFLYLGTSFIPSAQSKSNGWAVLLGILNGLIFAAVFLPRLYLFIAPGSGEAQTAITADITRLMRQMLDQALALAVDAMTGFWALIQPVRSIVLLLILIFILVGVSTTIRGGAKAKS